MSAEASVIVGVRCRALTSSELAKNEKICWTLTPEESRIALDTTFAEKHRRSIPAFRFDHIFGGSDNTEVHQNLAADIVWNAMEGYHGTIFAYGQTNSGKTYTMLGTDTNPGIIPHAVQDVFNYIKENSSREFLLRVSYMEIYNEMINDLLSKETNLQVHEAKERGAFVTGLKEEIITSPQQVMRIIKQGEANRHVSATDYNEHSSRSHTIFQMVIESRDKGGNDSSQNLLAKSQKMDGKVRVSYLCLIDLAGSEKVTTNLDRKKEGGFINRSLLTLGTVISKLSEGKSGHIPFRDSKLTRVLQPALGGKAKVAVICTLSPVFSSFEESHNTLQFASRAKNIPLFAQRNEIEDEKALLNRYKKEMEELKKKYDDVTKRLREYELKEESGNSPSVNGTLQEIPKEMQQELENLKLEKQRMLEEMEQRQNEKTKLSETMEHYKRIILNSSSITRNVSTDELFKLPESPQSKDLEQTKAKLQRQTMALEIQRQENKKLKAMLSQVTHAAAQLAQVCMPLEAEDILEESLSNDVEAFAKHLSKITSMMSNQQTFDPLGAGLATPAGKTNGQGPKASYSSYSSPSFSSPSPSPCGKNGIKGKEGVEFEKEQLFEAVETELEEKEITIVELETENRKKRETIQQQREMIEKLNMDIYKLLEKDALGHR